MRCLPHQMLRPTVPRRHISSVPPRRPRTALFFPGQGVQRVGMVAPWLESFPNTVQPLLDEMDDLLQFKLSALLADGPNHDLTATENAQPAIMATSIIILRVLEAEFGFRTSERVDVTLGHSLGEFAALVAGGYLRYAEALLLVRRRAEVMAQSSRKAQEEAGGGEYGMVALVCEEGHMSSLIDAIREFLGHASPAQQQDSAEPTAAIEQVLIANINSKNQIVLSGRIERIKELLTHLRQFGGHDPRAVQLKCDSPFHSPLMQPAADLMKDLLHRPSRFATGADKDVVIFPGRMPCISNVTARPFESREQLKDLVARGCVETVRWWHSIRYLDQEDHVRRWIGLGPGKVGRNLVGKEVGMRGRDTVKGGGVWAITDPREIEQFMIDLEKTDTAVED